MKILRLALAAMLLAAPARAGWSPADTLPAIWVPADGIDTGGLGIIAAHVATTDTSVIRWTNTTGRSLTIVEVFSYLSAGTPSATPVVVVNLEQPSAATEHLNFYVHQCLDIEHRQPYPNEGIVIRNGDALTFMLAAGTTGMSAAIKVMVR